MPDRIKTALIQNCAGVNFSENLSTLTSMIQDAANQGADLIALPEYCSHYGMTGGKLDVGAAAQADHQGLKAFQSLAASINRHILVGSIGVLVSDGRTNNRSCLLGPDGAILARYDKIHLFDVDLDGGESYRESASIAPGSQATLGHVNGIGVGLSICYDLRFPHLYRDLAKAGAQILSIPAAFTAKTGKAHWHTLARARAIETGCFVIAPSQCGHDPNGRLKRYGHSLIIAPWGEILADAGDQPGIILAELDLSQCAKARQMIPALTHDRPYTLTNPTIHDNKE